MCFLYSITQVARRTRKNKKNLVIAESGENDCFDDWKLLCVTVLEEEEEERISA